MALRDAIRSEMLTLVIEQNADLRSRLSLFAGFVCEGCGCAAVTHKLPETTRTGWPSRGAVCHDCYNVEAAWEWWDCGGKDIYAACISVGLRALCGRRILEGC